MKFTKKIIVLLFVITLAFVAIACGKKEFTMTLDKTKVELTVGDTYEIKPTLSEQKEVTYSSDNEEYVTVTKEGVVTAKGVGSAKVTLSCEDVTIEVSVTVKEKPVDMSFDITDLVLTVGDKHLLNVTTTDERAITYSSEDPSIATINRSGRVTAVNIGKTRVSATISETTIYCDVTVKEVPEVEIEFNLNYYEDDSLEEQIYTTLKTLTNTKVNEPTSPTREGFVFDGWFLDNTLKKAFDFENDVVNGNCTLYAKWHLSSLYTILFDQTTAAVENIVYEEGSDLSLLKPENPTKLGYLFDGWYLDSELTESFDFETSTVNKSIKLYAGWEKRTDVVIVTYHVNNTVYEQKLVDLYEFAEELQYTGLNENDFTSWVDVYGNEYNFNLILNKDLDLYAKFSLKLGAGLTTLDDGQFEGDLSLVDVEIDSSVTDLGSGTFVDCVNLKTVVIPAGVTVIPSDLFRGCENLTSVTYLGRITTIGDRAFYGCSSLSSLNIPSTVISLGEEAFSYCTGLDTVNIPSTVTELGSGLFMGCTNLVNITLPANTTVIEKNMFRGCISLNYTLSPSITEVKAYGFYNTGISGEITTALKVIGEYAFYGAQNISKITISKDVTSIGDYAFYNCINVETLDFEVDSQTNLTSLKSIGVASFACLSKIEELVLPEGLTSILDDAFRYTWGAFADCTSLKEVTIPSTITTYGFEGGNGSAMFYNCSSLETVNLADGLTTLGTHMFHLCVSLKNITIPASVSSIGGYIFYGCESIETLDLSKNTSLTSIPTYMLYNCTGLKSIKLPDSITSLGGTAFRGCTSLSRMNSEEEGTFILPKNVNYFGGSGIFQDCKSLVSFAFDSNNGEIAFSQYASSLFRGCTSLKNFSFEGVPNLTALPNQMFYGCTSLEQITLPATLTSLGREVFNHCESLKSIVIPAGVYQMGSDESLDYGEFSNCYSLESAVFEGELMTSIPNYTFYNCTSLKEFICPDSVTRVGESSFRNSGIETFAVKTTDSKLEEIEEYAFYLSSNLTTVTIYNTVKKLGASCFSSCTKLRTVGTVANVVSIQSNVEEIGSSFSGCSSITKVQFDSEYITTLPAGLFLNCNALVSINSDENGLYIIPEWITVIGPTVFRYNYNVKTIRFMGDVTYFGLYSMDGNTSLSSVYIYKNVTTNEEVPTPTSCFSNADLLSQLGFKVYVPSSSLAIYEENSTWLANDYTKYLVAM